MLLIVNNSLLQIFFIVIFPFFFNVSETGALTLKVFFDLLVNIGTNSYIIEETHIPKSTLMLPFFFFHVS